MKPYYRSKGITIYCGDNRDVLPQLRSVQAIVTDPPYGINFNTDYRRFTAPSGWKPTQYQNRPPVHGDASPFDPAPWLKFRSVILWGANCYSERLSQGRWLVWDKRFSNGKAFLADAEVAWMKGGHGVYIYAQTWQGAVRSERVEHPTQKPVGLMEWCISKTQGAILDPFMGSGTTLVAARNLKRKAIGIEIEERYCEIAARRLEGLKLKRLA